MSTLSSVTSFQGRLSCLMHGLAKTGYLWQRLGHILAMPAVQDLQHVVTCSPCCMKVMRSNWSHHTICANDDSKDSEALLLACREIGANLSGAKITTQGSC